MINFYLFITIFKFFNFGVLANTLFANDSTTIIIVENKTTEFLKIQSEYNPIIFFDQREIIKHIDTIKIKSKEPFRLVFYELDSNKQHIYTTYWLNPNEIVYIKKTLSETIIVSNRGQTRTNELNFFVQMQKSIGNFEGLITYIPHKRRSPSSLYSQIELLQNKRMAFLNNYEKTCPISKEYKNQLLKIFLYKKYIEFLSHCEFTEIFDKSTLNKIPMIENFLRDFEGLKQTPNNIYYLEAAKLNYKLLTLKNLDYYQYYYSARNELNGYLKEFIMFSALSYLTNNSLFHKIMDDFTTSILNDDLKQYAITKYGDYWAKNKVIDIPKNETDRINLFDLKSRKIVKWEDIISSNGIKYIDFWASWCGGCRASMPKVKEFEKNINNPDFKVIYISVDENSSVWEKVSKKENLPEENSYLLLNNESNSLLTKFGIKSIPRYMLVDDKGKILDENALDIYHYNQLHDTVLSILNR